MPVASAAVVGAVLGVPAVAARAALRRPAVGPALGQGEPVELLGRTPVLLALVAYHDVPGNALGPYREVVVALPVRTGGTRPLLHVLAMPVTAEHTRDVGRERWGLPKWRTPILGELRADGGRARVVAGDLLETAFAIELGATLPVPSVPVATAVLQRRGDALVRVPVSRLRARGLRVAAGGRLRLAVGSGPLADVLRTLGLEGRRPVATFSVRRASARIHAAEPVPPRFTFDA